MVEGEGEAVAGVGFAVVEGEAVAGVGFRRVVRFVGGDEGDEGDGAALGLGDGEGERSEEREEGGCVMHFGDCGEGSFGFGKS